MLDLLLTNGTLIDGHKRPRYQADVGIQGDRIVQIGHLTDVAAQQTIDVTGKIVAPGFVDVHNHSDGWLLNTPHLFSKTSQGFTTEVIMADGISYAPVNAQTAYEWIYYLRALACGFGPGNPDDYQLQQIRAEVEKGMAAGAVGLSTGLDYVT